MDHAWTSDQSNARKSLSSVDGLLDRMCTLMDIECVSGDDQDSRIDKVLDKMWQFNQTYSFGGHALVNVKFADPEQDKHNLVLIGFL